MYCKNCGKEVEKDVKYCPYCGSNMDETEYQHGPVKNPHPSSSNKNNKIGIIVVIVVAVTFIINMFVFLGSFSYTVKKIGNQFSNVENIEKNVMKKYNLNGFDFSFSTDKGYSIANFGDSIIVTSPGKAVATISFLDENYANVANSESYKTSLEQRGYVINNVTTKTYENHTYTIYETTLNSIKYLLAYTDAGNNKIVSISMMNYDEYDYSLLEELAPVINNAIINNSSTTTTTVKTN